MIDMRTSHTAATETLGNLSDFEQNVLRYVAEGLGPREISERIEIGEDHVYRLVAGVLDELEPRQAGETIDDLHARHGGTPARAEELDDFERRYGPSLPPDGTG